MAIRLNNASVLLAINAVVDQLDGAAGTLEVFTGAAPSECEDVDSGTLLAEVTLAAPAFGAAADQNPGGRATLLGVPLSDNSINASGTAGHFRIKTNGGTCIIQGTVGTSGADLIVDTTTFTSGAEFEIQSLTVDLAET